jgi:hypothetical protein
VISAVTARADCAVPGKRRGFLMRVLSWCWYLSGHVGRQAGPEPFRDLPKGGRKGSGLP